MKRILISDTLKTTESRVLQSEIRDRFTLPS